VPEPILMSIAAALAGKAVPALFEFVKNKFAGRKAAAEALAAAEGKEAESLEVKALSEELAKAEQADPEFGTELRKQWQVSIEAGRDVNIGSTITTNTVHNSGPINTISGNVTGKVIQAGDIHGNISF
jgi:hypothetical protein